MMADGGAVISLTASSSVWIQSTPQLPPFLKKKKTKQTNNIYFICVPRIDFYNISQYYSGHLVFHHCLSLERRLHTWAAFLPPQ